MPTGLARNGISSPALTGVSPNYIVPLRGVAPPSRLLVFVKFPSDLITTRGWVRRTRVSRRAWRASVKATERRDYQSERASEAMISDDNRPPGPNDLCITPTIWRSGRKFILLSAWSWTCTSWWLPSRRLHRADKVTRPYSGNGAWLFHSEIIDRLYCACAFSPATLLTSPASRLTPRKMDTFAVTK